MRIVAKIASAGVDGISRFPALGADIQDCLDAQGRLDEAKARKALDAEQIQIGKKDDRRILAFAMEYLHQTETVVRRLAQELKANGEVDATVSTVGEGEPPRSPVPSTPDTSPSTLLHGHSPTPTPIKPSPEPHFRLSARTAADRRCERNMNKGRYTFVRTDITSCQDGIHAKLTLLNPRNVVGNAERFARQFAVMAARILLYLQEQITTSDIILLEGDGAAGIFDEAREMNRIDDLRKMRSACARLRQGFCSPVNPDCPLYRNGECASPE